MKIINLSVLVAVGLSFTACSYTQSALDYAKEGTARVAEGYHTKSEMTKQILKYLASENKDCGVHVKMVNGSPVTTVKECIRVADALSSVDKVTIIKPQKVNDILQGAGDFFTKATGLVVPVASVYYGYKNNEINQKANVAMRQSDNQAQTSMWSNFTGKFQNNVTTTDTSVDKSVTDTQITTQENTNEKVPTISIDANSTNINGL